MTIRGRMRLVALVALALGSIATIAAEEPPCAVCHGEVAEGDHAHPIGGPEAAPACSDCHRNAAGHPRRGPDALPDTMMRFDAEPVNARAAVCLDCHEAVHHGPGQDLHRQAGIACDGCHGVHASSAPESATLPAGFDRLDSASALCGDCHQAVFAEFAFNERHRLAEGAVSCVSCHDPHKAERPSLLSHRNEETCGRCHESKTGPFVFEHAASRVDGCVSCHEPHGSANRHLLTHQREGELCYSCHATVPQFHVGFAPGAPPRFDENTVCTNCHTRIHGSNFDQDFLR